MILVWLSLSIPPEKKKTQQDKRHSQLSLHNPRTTRHVTVFFFFFFPLVFRIYIYMLFVWGGGRRLTLSSHPVEPVRDLRSPGPWAAACCCGCRGPAARRAPRSSTRPGLSRNTCAGPLVAFRFLNKRSNKYIHIYIYICACIHIYIYINVYIHGIPSIRVERRSKPTL